jgi:hypothetical protein
MQQILVHSKQDFIKFLSGIRDITMEIDSESCDILIDMIKTSANIRKIQ